MLLITFACRPGRAAVARCCLAAHYGFKWPSYSELLAADYVFRDAIKGCRLAAHYGSGYSRLLAAHHVLHADAWPLLGPQNCCLQMKTVCC